ncbi:MAG: adenylyl-sulfate kinase [Gammaproteobacteria bacterium]|nr:adenylyl-sulfate kinase [Gammaproteobacteria bacterium]
MSDKKLSSSNTVWHHATITRDKREQLHQHKSIVLWFTGLSGSGKSTLAHALEDRLHKTGCSTYVLDGDNVRHGLCGDLTFSDADRKENIRRIANVGKLFLDAGVIILTAFISPFREDRQIARNLMQHGDFFEIYCNSSIETCEQRDVKGLYKKARQGAIPHFTGISSPYEAPENPDIEIKTDQLSLEDSVELLIQHLKQRGILQ